MGEAVFLAKQIQCNDLQTSGREETDCVALVLIASSLFFLLQSNNTGLENEQQLFISMTPNSTHLVMVH